MARLASLCILLLCSIDPAIGARIQTPSGLDKQYSAIGKNPEQCKKYIKEKAVALKFRVEVFLGPDGCAAGPLDDGKLTEQGLAKICSEECLNNEELEYGAPDFTDLEKACTDADSVADLEIAKNSLPLHNYLQGVWENCGNDGALDAQWKWDNGDGNDGALETETQDENIEQPGDGHEDTDSGDIEEIAEPVNEGIANPDMLVPEELVEDAAEKGTVEECKMRILEVAEELGFRIGLFLGPMGCHAGPLHQGKLTELGKARICFEQCLTNADLVKPPPDFATLEETCVDSKSIAHLQIAKESLPVHDYLQGVWEVCPELDGKEPINEPVNEQMTKPEDTNGSDKSGGKSKPAVRIPKIVPIEALKPTRTFVAQMKLAYNFAAALATRSKKSCTTLRKVFSEFDYRHTGRLTAEQVAEMLDLLNDFQRKEAMDEFVRVQETAMHADFVTFMDVVNQKLDVTKSLRCYRAYATGSPVDGDEV